LNYHERFFFCNYESVEDAAITLVTPTANKLQILIYAFLIKFWGWHKLTGIRGGIFVLGFTEALTPLIR